MKEPKDKTAQKPKGSALKIFIRLFREYALRHWVRLLMGILSALIMSGAMRQSLKFTDLGVQSLAFPTKSDTNAANDSSILKNLESNKALSDTVKELQSSEGAVSSGKTDSQPPEAVPSSQIHDSNAAKLIKKLNSMTSRFGIHFDENEQLSFTMLCIIIGFMLLFFGIKSLGEFTNKYFLRWLGARIVADIRFDLFKNFQRQSMAYFSKNDVGQIISKCTNDASYIEHSFSNSIAEMLLSPLQIIMAVEFLVEKAVECNLKIEALFLIVAVPVFMVPIIVISKMIRKYQHAVLAKLSILVGRMQENLSGLRVVKAFNMEDFELKRFDKENSKYFKAVSKAILADIFMSPVMHVTALGLGAVFLIICYNRGITIITLAVMGYAASQAYKPIKELARMNSNLQRCAAAAERIFEALDMNNVIPEPASPIHVETLKDKICFNHVSFGYDKNDSIIKDFNLEIGKGQFVAVVGQTGSGKSTLANLLSRFYDPLEGSITIDGVDMRDISNEDLRKIIGIVPQDNFLFNESIAFNIRYSKPDANQNEIEAAAKRASAHDFIMDDSAGYSRPAGERGTLLSGGEKQRIAIARAILKNPPVLILDEATSAVDAKTEYLIQQAITELMQSRTVFAIAHRLSTIVRADKIILLDKGRIVEQGTHQELYELNGKYRQLYDMNSLDK